MYDTDRCGPRAAQYQHAKPESDLPIPITLVDGHRSVSRIQLAFSSRLSQDGTVSIDFHWLECKYPIRSRLGASCVSCQNIQIDCDWRLAEQTTNTQQEF